MSSPKSRTQLADEALARYYKQHNRPYLDNDGNGKFQNWVEDNGFDTDGIEEEFNVDADESTLGDVDNDFPCVKGKELSTEDIIAILKRCWTDPNAFTNEVPPLQVTADHWNFPDHGKKNGQAINKDIEETKEIYKDQCPTIFDQGMETDQAIMKLLAVGRRLNEPYLCFLADMYSRDRLKAGPDETLTTTDWALKNKHCLELKTIKPSSGGGSGKGPFTQTVSAVGSFFHRIVPKLMLNPQSEIVDSLEATAKYIAASVDFVCTIAKQPQLTCPFQVDTCIAFNKAQDCSKMAMQGIDDDDDDEDDGKGNDGDTFSSEFYDCFGNVKDRLNKEGCKNYATEINNDVSKDSVRGARMFMDTYGKFKAQALSTKYKGKAYNDYPRKHRFCSLIDRRDKDSKKGKSTSNDEIIFFEPPENCNKIPDEEDGHMPLWFFDSSRTCIIPNEGYENGKHLKDIDKMASSKSGKNNEEKALSEPITSSTPCKGAIMVLSFHVEADNLIRCYMYLNGQISRFMPDDIIKVLPRFFDKKFGNNAKFPKSKIAQELVERMKPQLRDIKFEAFYSE
eukprot:CAMPEP_0201570448 /NCGR_PEP_ID=MMETSP0190_2-20130828/12727_1 /ASSEMBLY_ACC=CAM_ASM_000263 /TAXON_ID=37353 /ORGANISM="Rosalina sp." /LENGTH=564 /DNA_ID=CAMNT_0047994011 /DNA_START=35 /DNA_END=1726 /DNA_ORIENTATION=+